MKLQFTKMHGCGNDYIYVDCVKHSYDFPDKSNLAVILSDRHFGIGSDGLIFINPSENADFEMEMYNADGSRAEMCGNGIRCVAKYVYDSGYTDAEEFTIESFGAVKYITVHPEDGKAKTVTVDMGEPILEAEQIPVMSGQSPVIAEELSIGGHIYKITCVSMGNPHAVVFSGIDGSVSFDLSSLPIEQLGPEFEHHEKFPKRTNTEFIHVTDRNHIELRVWERGAGETLCCGTGCCAACVAGVLNGLTERDIDIKVLGGSLHISWDPVSNHIFMTGPAETVFTGEIDV